MDNNVKPRVRKQKLNKNTMKRVFAYILKTYKVHILLTAIFILISALATLQGVLFIQKLIDVYILPMIKNGSSDFTLLATALGKLCIWFVIGIGSAYGYNRIMVLVGQGTMEKMRIDLFNHMESLPISYFDSNNRGDIMSVYTNDIDTMRQLISQTIPQFINGIITMLVTFISMLIMSIPLSLVSILMVTIQFLTAKNIVAKSRIHFQKQQSDLGREDGYIEEMMAGQKIVKVFNYEDRAVESFKEINDELNNSSNMANRYANILMPVNVNIGNLSYILIAIVGAGFSIANLSSLTLGKLVSFLTLNRNFSQPISMMSQQINYISMAMAGAERIFEMMDEKPEINEGYVQLVNVEKNQNGELIETSEYTGILAWKHPHKADGSVTYQELNGKITMDHVDFSYDGNRQILNDITLFGHPGEKISFVGSTGAGKTTITNLINRFYSIADGKIRYDDININKIKMDDLRKSLGIVLQDVNLFTGTILDNIRYGKLDATDEECIEAAKLANADSFIRKLPKGYDTIISANGGNLSQGECQLLSIARVAVANPPVMILDEATSSIDTRTEALVQKGMDALMQGRTTFVIAHRLSTVQNSDCIIVLEQGKIIERGTHNELLSKKGRYYQLYTGNQIAS
ncbi:MAG: ABC transporter ATP-binding protein [Sphaerochaeta sp.]